MAKQKSESKADLEVQFDVCIYYCLNSLLKYQDATEEEFHTIFKPQMFAKENTKAFIYVTHYLFNILDQKTFQRRFHWPLTDRKYESEYRLSTVEYLNDLIKQNQLVISLVDPGRPGRVLNKITATHVIHPGGFRFQQLLLDIIKMVMASVIQVKDWTALTPARDIATQLTVVEKTCNDLKKSSDNLVALINEAEYKLKDRIYVLDNGLKMVLPAGDEHVAKLLEMMRKLRKYNMKRYQDMKLEDQEIRRRLEKYRDFCKLARVATKPYTLKEVESKNFDAVLATLRQQFDSANSSLSTVEEEKNGESSGRLTQVLELCSLALPGICGLMQQFEKVDIRDVKYDSKKISPILQSTSELTGEVSRLLRIVKSASPSNSNNVSSDLQTVFDNSSQLILIPPPIVINLRRRTNMSLLPRLMQSPSDTVNLRNQSLIDTITGRRGLSSVYKSMRNMSILSNTTISTVSNNNSGAKKKNVLKKPLIDSAALLLRKPSVPKKKRSLSPIPSYSVVMANNLEQSGKQGRVLSSTVLENSITTPNVPFNLKSPLSTIKIQPDPAIIRCKQETNEDKSSGIEMSEEMSPDVSENVTVLNCMKLAQENKSSSSIMNSVDVTPKEQEKSGFFNATAAIEEKENILNTSDNILVDDSF